MKHTVLNNSMMMAMCMCGMRKMMRAQKHDSPCSFAL